MRPVGFFDSGIGGTCIEREFQRLCPTERTVYIADSEHCPYGNRPESEIRVLAADCTRRLLEKDCKLIVVACNTATAAAIDNLRSDFPLVPFVGVEPAIKPAAAASRSGTVAVLATAGTFAGRHYRETAARYSGGVRVLTAIADEFVEIVERLGPGGLARLKGAEAAWVVATVRRRIEPLLAEGADQLVLGCTHFPHLKPIIERVAAGRAAIVDPSSAVARQIRSVLEQRGLLGI